MTGSGAFQWHVTFDSLKNAGDVPVLFAQLLGSSAAIDIREIRKGSSNAIYRIDIPSHPSRFSIHLERHVDEIYFLDFIGNSLEGG